MWEIGEDRASQDVLDKRIRKQCGGITETRFSRWREVVRLARQVSDARWYISHGWPGQVLYFTPTHSTSYFDGIERKINGIFTQ